MLQWERYHDNSLCWLKRPDGFTSTGSPPVTAFCILLTSDDGTDTKEIQLTSDDGTDTHCAQLTTTTS